MEDYQREDTMNKTPWPINAELVDVTVSHAGNITVFDAIEIHCTGIWVYGGGPKLLLEDSDAPGYDDDDNRDTVPTSACIELAHLIAAAPAMLAALEVALEYISGLDRSPDGDAEIDLIDAAIAAAKGV